MTRKDLIKDASDRCGIAERDVEVVYGALLGALADEFQREGRAVLQNFGVFETRIWPMMVIKLTDGTSKIRPRTVKLVFLPNKKLRAYMNLKLDDIEFVGRRAS
jgi:nucleoid DNA-binding protein